MNWHRKSQRSRVSRIGFISVVIAILALVTISTVALAISAPNVLTINAVGVYRNCLEDLDQLYIVDYTIDYDPDSNPLTDDNPDENVTEAFLVRLMDGAAELKSAAPYAYYDEGYDRGVVAIYFSAADAPAWEGDYTIKLMGNPTLEWDGDPPSTTVSSFDLWQDYPISSTRTWLAGYILAMADTLEIAWSVDMIETTASGSKLTSLGEAYFTSVIEDLRTMAPTAFSGQITQPEVEKREFTKDYSDDLAATVVGTPFDLTPLGDAFNLSREVVTTVLYYGVVVIFIVLLVRKIGSTKPAILMSLPFVIGGAFFGVPLVISILAGFTALAMIAYVLFYQKSSA